MCMIDTYGHTYTYTGRSMVIILIHLHGPVDRIVRSFVYWPVDLGHLEHALPSRGAPPPLRLIADPDGLRYVGAAAAVSADCRS